MALLSEVKRQRAFLVVPGIFEVADNVAQERERSQDPNFLPTILACQQRCQGHVEVDNTLLFWFYAIFLWCDKIEEGLRTPVQLVQTPILRLLLVFRANSILVEDCEEERPMVKSAILDSVVELRNLQPTSERYSLEGFAPRRTLEGSNFSCFTSQKSSNSFSHRSRNNHGSSPQHLKGHMTCQSTHFICVHASFNEPSLLDFIDVQRLPILVHDFAE